MHDKVEKPVSQGYPRLESLLGGGAALRHRWLRLSLPGKLLLLTGVFVLLAEVLIFLPSISSFRTSWLRDRITASYLSALAADAAPERAVPAALRNELLRSALVRAVGIRRDGQPRLVLPPITPLNVAAEYDLRYPQGADGPSFSQRLSEMKDALAIFFRTENRTIKIYDTLGPRYDDIIEVVLEEDPLKRAMWNYGSNIFWLSVVISLLTAAVVYFALSKLLVQPMMRLTRNMLHFSEHPEDQSRIITPTGRTDEIGEAERELANMQRQLSQALVQKNRLAQLGLAVSKISHDLRNMLANAQLISDRLTDIPDPTVQRFAPKLIASLDRAINYCNDSLKFGRSQEAAPRRELIRLRPIVAEVGDGLGLPREGAIDWTIDMEETLQIDADHEHLFRVLSNLVRNAVQAIESQGEAAAGEVKVKAWREGRRVFIDVSDDGPGVPQKARANLFRAFQGQRKGGTGLGLVIAAELIAAHGGSVRLLDTRKGATFRIEMPDRGNAVIPGAQADTSADINDPHAGDAI